MEHIKLLRSAAKAGFSNVRKATHGEGFDINVKIYEKLTPQQFEKIRSVYGDDGLARYIKTMEYRRLKNGNT